jgi:hypothetical protein
MTGFVITITRDRAPFLRRKTIRVPITLDDGGFKLVIEHFPHDPAPVVLNGYIGKDEMSTVVEFKDAPRLKRKTPRR